MAQQKRATRGRGRPRLDSDNPPLTPELIARAALAFAAENGFPALTMRHLADDLGVTVRALYNHVANRQEVIDLVAARIMELQPHRDLDADQWESSIRALYHDARAAYRTLGRALLFSLDETVTPGDIPANRILLPEQLLDFLTTIGLSLPDALTWRSQFLCDVFSFSLLVDYRFDRANADERRMMHDPVPKPWLDAHPQVDAPFSRRAAELPPTSSDEQFEQTVERAILAAKALMAKHYRRHTDVQTLGANNRVSENRLLR